MEHSLIILLTVLFFTVKYASADEDLVISTISETRFCEPILKSTESALIKTLEASFVSKSVTRLDEKDNSDFCCRSLLKCNSYKNIQYNYTNDWNIRQCDCEYFFRTCLDNLNTTLAKEFAFIHIANTTKCYANDYPIVKCIKFDTYLESNDQFSRFSSLSEREQFARRCLKYKLDETKTKQIQLFDLSFHGIASNAINGTVLSIKLFFVFLLFVSQIVAM